MAGKSLDSTLVRGGEVKIGGEIFFINPAVIGDGRARRIHESMVEGTVKELGEAPYEVVAITNYRPDLTMVTIKGKNGKQKEMNRGYFTA